MVLLHRTPYICINGFGEHVITTEAVTALMTENPNFPLTSLLYCWGGPRDEAGSSKALHLIIKDHPPAISIGENLASLGAHRMKRDPVVNPNVTPI